MSISPAAQVKKPRRSPKESTMLRMVPLRTKPTTLLSASGAYLARTETECRTAFFDLHIRRKILRNQYHLFSTTPKELSGNGISAQYLAVIDNQSQQDMVGNQSFTDSKIMHPIFLVCVSWARCPFFAIYSSRIFCRVSS